MQSENVLESELQPTAGRAANNKSNKTTILIWAHAITFLLGLALLVFVIYRIGYESILQSVARVGWGFFLVLALNLARHLSRAASLYLAVEPERRTFKYRSAVAARFGGEKTIAVEFEFVEPVLVVGQLGRSFGLHRLS